jgi:predicted transcriptional regulator
MQLDFKNLENIVFSGLYKVVSVDSIFDGGKFTQVLDLVRFNNQGKEMTSVASLSEMQKIVEKKKAEATAKATGNSSPNITDTEGFTN